jgi:hypothetical protein
MAIPDGRWVIASFTAIAVSLITINTAHTAPVRGINASAIAEASFVEKSVIFHRAPRHYTCWWQGWRRICGWHPPLAKGSHQPSRT